MTLKECFDYVDEIKPNAFSNATKTVWMNEVEGMVQTEIFLLAEEEVFSYYWSLNETTPVTIVDDRTIGVADKDVLKKFRIGGKLDGFEYESPAHGYSTRAKLPIRGISADGIVLDAGTFDFTDNTPYSTALKCDGSGSILLVEPPHCKIYPEYIMARIDYANGEYDKYANTMQMFNAFWGEFSRWFARMYRPADMKKGRCCHELCR